MNFIKQSFKESLQATKQQLNKSISTMLIIITIISILIAPVLHESFRLNNQTTISHFSILNSIQMDMSEHQSQTIYFLSHI